MTIDCLNWSRNATAPAKFEISNDCALFDFVVYPIVVGLLTVLGVAGNTISFVVLLKDNSATSFLLRALAVADTLVLISAVPLYVLAPVYTYTGLLRGYYEVYMNIMPFLWPIYLIPYTGTIFLTVLVSLNRFEAVCRPFQTRKLFDATKIRRHVVYIAVFSVLYNIPRFFEYEQVEECSGYNFSREAFQISAFGGNTVYRVVYANVMYFVVMHGGPLLSLAFFNANLIRALKAQARKRTEMKMAGYQQDVTLVLVVVVFVFICCQTPTFVDHILWTVLDESRRSCGQWHYYYTAIGDMLAILNSSVNFVIYILTSPKFRQNLVEMCLACDGGGCAAGRTGADATTTAAATRGGGVGRVVRTGRTETILLCTPQRDGGTAAAVDGCADPATIAAAAASAMSTKGTEKNFPGDPV